MNLRQTSRWLAASIAVGIAMLAGCAPAARVNLVQPQLSGWQRELRLESDQVYWAQSEGVDRLLADLPLPGARTGRPTYLIYLRWPAGAKSAGAGDKNAALRGFIIQTRGSYAGLARINGGQITISGTLQAKGATRRVVLDLRCEDGTQIVGAATASRDDYAVSHFETRRRPADVQALVRFPAPTTSQPKP